MTMSAQPPTDTGALAKREARLAWGMLLPTITAVSLVVALPLLAIFWISFKPVSLADLRAPEMVVRESLRLRNDTATLDYRVNNSSRDSIISGAAFTDTVPDSVSITGELPEFCRLDAQLLSCDFGDLSGGFRERYRIDVEVSGDPAAAKTAVEDSVPVIVGDADGLSPRSRGNLFPSKS